MKISDWLVENSQLIVIIGGVLTLIGGYFAYKKSDRDQYQMGQAVQRSISATGENQKLSEQNLELVRSVKGLAERLSEMTARVEANTTGGTDVFLIIHLLKHYEETGRLLSLTLKNRDEHPIYGLRVTVYSSAASDPWEYNRGTIIPKDLFSFEMGGIPQIQIGATFSYLVSFQWNNGYLFYVINVSKDSAANFIVKNVSVSINGKDFKDPTKYYEIK